MRTIQITEDLIIGKVKIPAGSTIKIDESTNEIEDRTIINCKNNTNAINGHRFLRPTDSNISSVDNWIIYHFPNSLVSNSEVEQAIDLLRISWRDDSWSKELSEFFDEHDLDFDTVLFVDLDKSNIDSIISNKHENSEKIEKLNKENKIPVVVVELSKSFMKFIYDNKINVIELSEKSKLDIIVKYFNKHVKRVYRVFSIGE